MKRGVLVLAVFSVVFILLVLSLVSANIFSDVWSKITGKAVYQADGFSAVRDVNVRSNGRVDVKIKVYFDKNKNFIIEEEIPDGFYLKSVSPKYNKPIYNSKQLADEKMSWLSWLDSRTILTGLTYEQRIKLREYGSLTYFSRSPKYISYRLQAIDKNNMQANFSGKIMLFDEEIEISGDNLI